MRHKSGVYYTHYLHHADGGADLYDGSMRKVNLTLSDCLLLVSDFVLGLSCSEPWRAVLRRAVPRCAVPRYATPQLMWTESSFDTSPATDF